MILCARVGIVSGAPPPQIQWLPNVPTAALYQSGHGWAASVHSNNRMVKHTVAHTTEEQRIAYRMRYISLRAEVHVEKEIKPKMATNIPKILDTMLMKIKTEMILNIIIIM